LTRFITSYGQVVLVGVEGTGSYGAGLTRHLRQTGIRVADVERPKKQQRNRGKNDSQDAYHAAASALSGQRLAIPKIMDADVDAIRRILNTRRSADHDRTQAINQLNADILTAPSPIRETYRDLNIEELVPILATTRPGSASSSHRNAIMTVLRRLARRIQYLNNEISDADTELALLVRRTNPSLYAAHGVGPISAAQLLVAAGENPERITTVAKLAALCGVSPVEASSGPTIRHRLNRGGNRQANNALHIIIHSRVLTDPTTREYHQRRTTEGKTYRETIRCLKTHLCREIYHHLLNPHDGPDTTDLRSDILATG
jgi:transposase